LMLKPYPLMKAWPQLFPELISEQGQVSTLM